MTINKDLFFHDPTQSKIPNDGVAKVLRPETDQQWDVLRWELRSFVCEGQYERGLERILDSFLKNLSTAQQPAVWISGFYGSGKSHLARVLEQLWRDLEFNNADRARDLVNLPADIKAQLVELSTAGKRQGGLWSAAGTLGAGKSNAVRLAFLSILFDSAGLPEDYSRAKFVLWAKSNGYLATLKAHVEQAGKSFDKEVNDLFVSPHIAAGLLEADSELGQTAKDVRELLKAQFSSTVKDITDKELFDTVKQVLEDVSDKPGKWPLALIVLDELQQYINDDNAKALEVQNIIEGIASEFKSQILIVATGQSALTATPTLAKLTDRFPVQVALSDKDVESVVRSVVLRKKPDRLKELEAKLDAVSGEIDQHLGGTQLAPKGADKAELPQDYPLLPTRRRFWELALRAIDHAGKAGVLRTQLRIVHEAASRVADAPIGTVVGADFVYDEQSPGMLQSGVLLKEIDELIQTLRTKGPEGALKARICALIFLINQIPENAAGAGGLGATAGFIADLLVEDLDKGGATLRKQIPSLLAELVTDGHVMQIGDKYALQTEEGAEWEQDYRSNLANFRDDPTKLTTVRNEGLVAAVDAELSQVKLVFGKSKTPRTLQRHWGPEEPSIGEDSIPVWIQDEWNVTEASVKKAAAAAGDESPIVFVLLPKWEADAIKDASASMSAAKATLHRPMPHTDEGRAAQQAMRTRLSVEEEKLKGLSTEVVRRARVFQGGGGESTVATLAGAVQSAAGNSFVRLFPKFGVGDHADWGKVIQKARDGAPDALASIGYTGEVLQHPVCKEVFSSVNAAGVKGADLQKRFAAPPYGWPKDAVTGAVLVLLASGNVRATLDNKDLSGPKELPQTQIGKVVLFKEDEPPTTPQKLQLRSLLTAAGIKFENGQETPQVPALLEYFRQLAKQCGGPAPLPEPPTLPLLDELDSLGGNQRARAVADAQTELNVVLKNWVAIATQREQRLQQWRDFERLLQHAGSIAGVEQAAQVAATVRDQRRLLEDPDPIQPYVAQLSTALRQAFLQRNDEYNAAVTNARAALEQVEGWTKLTEAQRGEVLTVGSLSSEPAPEVGSTTALLASLDHTSLDAWKDRLAFVEPRLAAAQVKVAQLLEPASVSVKVPTTTIKTEQDLDAYLEAIHNAVHPHLQANQTVII